MICLIKSSWKFMWKTSSSSFNCLSIFFSRGDTKKCRYAPAKALAFANCLGEFRMLQKWQSVTCTREGSKNTILWLTYWMTPNSNILTIYWAYKSAYIRAYSEKLRMCFVFLVFSIFIMKLLSNLELKISGNPFFPKDFWCTFNLIWI